MIKTIGHSVRSLYNSAKAKINGASLRRKSVLLLVEEELEHIKENPRGRDLPQRVGAIRYLLKKL